MVVQPVVHSPAVVVTLARGDVIPLTPRGLARRMRLAERDGGMRCAYCKAEHPPELLVLEHVVPHSAGGRNADFNRVLACRTCDGRKRDRTPQEWRPGHHWGVRVLDHPSPKRRKSEITVSQGETVEVMGRYVRPGGPKLGTYLRWCATCGRVVDVERGRNHPRSHLLLEDASHEF